MVPFIMQTHFCIIRAILNKDSLKEYDGTYKIKRVDAEGHEVEKTIDFPADAFILNPPYSAPGNGMVFVEKALSMMSKGYAAIIIQTRGFSLPPLRLYCVNQFSIYDLHSPLHIGNLSFSHKNQIEWSREILCFALVPERGAAERCNIAESLQARKNVCSVPMYL